MIRALGPRSVPSLALLAALCLGAVPAAAEEGRRPVQRVDSGRAGGIEATLGAEVSIRPYWEGLELGPALSLGLSRGAVSAWARLPFRAGIGPDRRAVTLGDFGLGVEAAGALGGTRLAVGAQALAPTGRAPPGERGSGPGSACWKAGASVEAARLLDPAVAAARVDAALLVPRRGLAAAAYPELSLSFSFAEALNASISLALSASVEAAFPKARGDLVREFSGGTALALAWRGRAISCRAGLSLGLGEGAAAGPALVMGVSYALRKE